MTPTRLHRRLLQLTLAAIALTAAMTACKTNQNNYRQSYQSIVDKRQSERTAEDSLLTGDFYSQGRTKTYALGCDTLRVRVDYVRPDHIDKADTAPLSLETFYTVVGQFRQVFNARAMAQRLSQQGYTVAILHNNVPEYFVAIRPCSMAIDALRSLQQARTDTTLRMRPPCPWTLQPAQMSR